MEMDILSKVVKKTTAEELAEIDQQLEKARNHERYLHQQQKIAQKEANALKKNERDHRIFTWGATAEKFMRKPLLMTKDQFGQLMKIAFNTKEVLAAEDAMIAENIRQVCEEEGGDPG